VETSPTPPADSLFENAFEHAAIGMALVAPNGRWLKVNRTVCKITGYTEAELLQCTFQDITHPDDLDLDVANVGKMLAGEIQSYQMPKRYLHKDGGIVWVLLSVSLARDAAGEPSFFISQIQDITRAVENERAIEEAAAEIRKLRRGLLKICSWSKRIEVDGKWITVDEFLRDHLGLELTHAMSGPATK
jgi:PAS domain S-box-containing protein